MSAKFIDLFAGIGGFHVAFHNLGAECVFASEWDEYARKTYEGYFKSISPKMFMEGRFAGDITKITKSKRNILKTIPKFNVLCAGFPCQPFSQAGFKKGFSEPRGTLFHDIVAILKARKPDAYFLENVRHLHKHDGGRTFNVIKATLESRAVGYTFIEKVVKASDFGLPQHRPRLFMVGFKDKKKAERFSFPEPIKLEKTMTDIFGASCTRKIGYTLRCGGRKSPLEDRRNWDGYIVDGKERRLTSREGKKMMGFPADFKFPTTVTENQAMKQLGNSVAIPAIQATAERILIALGCR